MRVTCPACHAELSLDAILASEMARHAIARMMTTGLPFGGLLLRYVALFRPEKRGLSIERMAKLITELLPDIERRAITRKGRDWSAPLDLWQAAIEVLFTKRDKGTLTLPLTSHGLLFEVMVGLVDRQEAKAEAVVEAVRRQHRDSGPRENSAVDLGHLVDRLAIAAPESTSAGPSEKALALRAELAARKQRRQEAASGDEEESAA